MTAIEIRDKIFETAINTEERYKRELSSIFGTEFKTLEEGLDKLFNLKPEDKLLTETKTRKENDYTFELAVQDVEKILNTMKPDLLNHWLNGLDLTAILKQKKAQIGMVDKSNANDYSKSEMRRGYVDEVKTQSIAINAVETVIDPINKEREKNGLKPIRGSIQSIHGNKDDYTISLYILEPTKPGVLGFNFEAELNIDFENKLDLQKRFHLTGENKITQVNTIIGNVMPDIKKKINAIKAQGKQMSLFDNNDNNLLNKIEVDLSKGSFRETLAWSLLYQKLKSVQPVFVTNIGGKIRYRLCSEVIGSAMGNLDLELTGLPETVSVPVEGELDDELETTLRNDILKKVSRYDLWYGK